MKTVVLLTALDLEYQTVRRYLDDARTRSHPAGTLFELGKLPDAAGNIALAVTGEGNVSAAVLAERAIAMFQPQALLCAGIAGGLHDDIALGDVVVATKIYAVHGGCEKDDRFLARPKAWHASHGLEQLARHVARTGTWTGRIPKNSPSPDARDSRLPKVHFRPVASGEVVLSATGTSLPTLLHDTYNDAVAIEMESAGIAQAAQLNRSVPALSVRGISDRADASKHIAEKAGWQQIAAERAAAFTVSIAALVLRSQVPATSYSSARDHGEPARCQSRHVRLSRSIDLHSGSAAVRRTDAR